MSWGDSRRNLKLEKETKNPIIMELKDHNRNKQKRR